MEQFTIPDTLETFVNWVNWYGHTRQQHYIPYGAGRDQEGRMHLCHSVTSPRNQSWGEINFYIELDPNKEANLVVTAEASAGLHPPEKELLNYLQEMAAAIRKRWSPKVVRVSEPRIKAHADALKRLKAGEHKIVNRNKWKEEYAAEKEVEPGYMESNGDEIYRKSVWDRFTAWEKSGGKT